MDKFFPEDKLEEDLERTRLLGSVFCKYFTGKVHGNLDV
jgi:hypothetical protein